MSAATQTPVRLGSRASLPTVRASRYLQQLCKHWSHRLEVEYDATAGLVRFGEQATCRLAASDDCLSVLLESPDAEALARLREIVATHLRRFAYREQLEFDWQPL